MSTAAFHTSTPGKGLKAGVVGPLAQGAYTSPQLTHIEDRP
jgi:hypothetical protein